MKKTIMLVLLVTLNSLAVQANEGPCYGAAVDDAKGQSDQNIRLVGIRRFGRNDTEYKFQAADGSDLFESCAKDNSDASDENGCDCRPGSEF